MRKFRVPVNGAMLVDADSKDDAVAKVAGALAEAAPWLTTQSYGAEELHDIGDALAKLVDAVSLDG